MRDVLRELKNRIGVRGALIMSSDGVVVASELCDELDADSVAALASPAISAAVRAAEAARIGATRRVMLTAGFGRLVFVLIEELILVVVTEPTMDLELTLLEIAGPAQRIRELSKLDSPR
jgi:predicted regulator of Ras-like GTPase activity (Roadblock/LC7/MglB family)